MESRIASFARGLAAVALAGLLAALSAGCSGGGGDDVASAGMSLEAITAELAAWSCADQAACCDAVGEVLDREACEERTATRLMRGYATSMRETGRAFDAAAAARCSEAIASTPPSCAGPRDILECSSLLDGAREIGESCTNKIECRGQAVGEVGCIDGLCARRAAPGGACSDCDDCRGRDLCRRFAEAVTDVEFEERHCYERRQGSPIDGAHDRGAAGDACHRTCGISPQRRSCSESVVARVHDPATTVVSTCFRNDGLQCASSGVCEPLLALGAACENRYQCGGSSNCRDGICVPGAAEGEACSPAIRCAEGLVCRDLQCAPAVPEGGACGEGNGGFAVCAEDLVCSGPRGNGRCTTYARSVCESAATVPSRAWRF